MNARILYDNLKQLNDILTSSRSSEEVVVCSCWFYYLIYKYSLIHTIRNVSVISHVQN